MSTEILLFELRALCGCFTLYVRRQRTTGDNAEVQQWLLCCDGLMICSKRSTLG